MHITCALWYIMYMIYILYIKLQFFKIKRHEKSEGNEQMWLRKDAENTRSHAHAPEKGFDGVLSSSFYIHLCVCM